MLCKHSYQSNQVGRFHIWRGMCIVPPKLYCTVCSLIPIAMIAGPPAHPPAAASVVSATAANVGPHPHPTGDPAITNESVHYHHQSGSHLLSDGYSHHGRVEQVKLNDG